MAHALTMTRCTRVSGQLTSIVTEYTLFAMQSRSQLAAQRRLGRFLRTARIKRTLSLQDVASPLGYSRQFVCDLERGLRVTADVRLWIQLAYLLECDSRELLTLAWQARGALTLPAMPKEHSETGKFIAAIAAASWVGSKGGPRQG